MNYIIIPWAVCLVIILIREVELKLYCKRKNYKVERKGLLESLMEKTRTLLLMAIPLINIVIAYAMLTKNTEELLKPMFEKGLMYKVDENGEKITYRRFSIGL